MSMDDIAASIMSMHEIVSYMIKTEVQAAVAQHGQVEVDDLRNALAVAQSDLNSTRDALIDLRAAFTTTEDNLRATRTDLDNLREALDSSHDKPRKAPVDVTNRRDTLTTAENDVPILRDDRRGTPSTAEKDMPVPGAKLDKADQRLGQVQIQPPALSNRVTANTIHTKLVLTIPSEDALRHYATGLRLQFKDTLPYARKLCGTSDPWVVQELLNEQSTNRTTSKFNSFQRLVLKSHDWHPIFHILKESDNLFSPHSITIDQLHKRVVHCIPGTSLTCLIGSSATESRRMDPLTSASTTLREVSYTGIHVAAWRKTATIS